jgi:hypothetical protein
MLARAILALAALALSAVLAVQALSARADVELTRLVLNPTPLTAQQRARADVLLRRADRLSLDTRTDLERGTLRARADDARGAGAQFESVVRREPQNLEAWALLARAAERYDPALAATARARVRKLAPPVR